MIQLKTMLNCIDNSGAAVVECVNVLKKKTPARVGDRIVVVVQKQRNFGPENSTNSGIANKVRRGDIRHAVVVRAKKEIQRPDGSVVKFDDNACVLVNKSGDPIGTRLNGQSTSAVGLCLKHGTNSCCRSRRRRITGKAVVQDSVSGTHARVK
ncbi:50S ribosomal protein L14 [Rasamsonia emersonii CBS 393.64]|uniref:Large ribosomal subunit protein uL14m n=1 Tax=Rasamsonia emersonii (strain ATCC 16479 / CBS 393.64 / IMI 116815) TaxID=1408163 RepID=A0A0F4YMA6_RASE3|nr:50S ribosomal protein L14 [Rasamsonia emersonii CBS 393.64]KKA18991.1 50S ribosomal protein L14 [Rasamsonia emersonii CBS 393.64]